MIQQSARRKWTQLTQSYLIDSIAFSPCFGNEPLIATNVLQLHGHPSVDHGTSVSIRGESGEFTKLSKKKVYSGCINNLAMPLTSAHHRILHVLGP